jgi:hypothetical protein
MGTKRGKGEKSFVRETRKQTIDFYRDLVQDLRPWRAAPPKLPVERVTQESDPVAVPVPASRQAEGVADPFAPAPPVADL